jgi:uncharacterized phage infection (PIP) family protein YhgE
MTRVKLSELVAVKAELDELVAQTKRALAEATDLIAKFNRAHTEILAKKSNVDSADEDLTSAKNAALAKSEEMQVQLNKTSELSQRIESFSAKVDSLEQKNTRVASSLDVLNEKAIELTSEIESLLPGATSAGLSVAFKERKDSYRNPRMLWSGVFGLSIFLLLLFAFLNPSSGTFELVDPNDLVRYFFARLPVFGPLVWLAIYASHRHGQALQLEEEYAHKEALSKSFEGYKKQLLEIEGSEKDTKGTEELIAHTLSAIAENPGRIYDKRREETTPVETLMRIFKGKRGADAQD